jgi:sigma-B regulation protein RsbU (phosphoserine phosphatase)
MQSKESSQKQLELDSLIEFSQLINSNLNLEFILGNILLSIMGKMLISKGIVLIKKDEENSEKLFKVESVKGLDNKLIGSVFTCDCPKFPVFHRNDLKENIGFFEEYNIEFFFKIYFGNKLLGILCLGEKINNTGLSKHDIIFIETLLNISASSIENTLRFNEIKQLNINLSGKLNQLKSLFELSKEFNSNFQDRDKIIRLLKYTLLGNYGIPDLLILSKYKSDKFYLFDKNKSFDIEKFDLGELEKINKPIIISENHESNTIKYLSQNNYTLIIPVLKNERVENLVCLGKKLNKTEYSESDIEFLESIVNLSIISIENTILFNEFLDKQKIEDELRIAREIQVALLPKEIPEIKNYQISAENIPALHVGGDYFDVIKLSETKLALVIADVSGKGTPASLLMANIQSAVHSFLKLYIDGDFILADVTQKINELIYENTGPEKFITFFWGILDSEDNSFTYVNAGHNPPFHFSSGSFCTLDKGGLIIGIMDEGITFETGRANIQENDILVLYTDGVNEALDKKRNEFGEERLKKAIHSSEEEHADCILKKIKDSLKHFTAGTKQYDDITLIVVKKIS